MGYVGTSKVTSSGSGTAVFAVRGTTDFFDALQDMDLWLPVFMMYIFENLGPNVTRQTCTIA